MPSSIICTTVFPACPVSSSIYGYYPSLGANTFFCAFFGVALLADLLFGIRYKTWTFMIALSLGCLTEAIGYMGRILLHSDPFSNAGFEIQIFCLIMAPAFVSAALYLTLKHITLCFGKNSTVSRLVTTLGFSSQRISSRGSCKAVVEASPRQRTAGVSSASGQD
jgi:hypothetical protein